MLLLLATLIVACSTSAEVTPPLSPTSSPQPAADTASPTPTLVPAVTASPAPTSPPSPTLEPTPTPAPPPATGPLVSIGEAQFMVDVADTSRERSQGLSGRPNLAPGAGMLFMFEQPGVYTFWMIEMQFPLDFVWISADCVVLDLTQDVPAPQPGQRPEDLPRYRPAAPVQYILEINAGEIESAGINSGDAVAFRGDLSGTYGC